MARTPSRMVTAAAAAVATVAAAAAAAIAAPTAGNCGTFAAVGGAVRMPATAAAASDGWVAGTYFNKRALMFKPNGGGGVDPPGSGLLHYTFRADVAGTYNVVLRSNAPHVTEHNDVWVRVGGGGSMFKGTPNNLAVVSLTDEWVKLYQNTGGDRWHVGGVTKDHDGHKVLTRPLEAGEELTVTLSGRSSRYAIADVMAVVCDPKRSSCGSGWAPYDAMVADSFSSRCTRCARQ
ncbi:hypothetical protein BU14_0640s0009 [Porphyra umbilicalis]|uniref:Uncharacterized protein n=1 Tax=Porphyra umbilicalis TaxID=2786 RepID=A0A1X6NR74_PORUM|nr:hypothetical protein BU14_0640s0009 [Porphyra umbilicalis]|eukprot:OSX70903.1 hypothetical protein BU14_0640s0009 [Porphyra umbilicalis]